MRTWNLRLGIWAYLAFILYLSEANILHQIGVVNLPLSFETTGLESFGIQLALLIMLLLGLLAMAVVKRRRRLEAAAWKLP